MNALAFTPNGSRALSAGVDETVRLWDVQTGEELASLRGHEGAIFAIAVDSVGRRVATAGLDRSVHLWDLDQLELIDVLPGHLGPVWALEFSHDGRYLLSGGGDEVVRIWDMESGREVGVTMRERERPPLDLSGDPLLQRGEKVYRTCAICHSLSPGSDRRAGPSLHGIFGRRAGTLADYNYSEALRDSDIIWGAETIAELFRQGPDVYTPGSKMPVQRVGDEADLEALVAYLKATTAAEKAN